MSITINPFKQFVHPFNSFASEVARKFKISHIHPKNGKTVSLAIVSFSDGQQFTYYKYNELNKLVHNTVGCVIGGKPEDDWTLDKDKEFVIDKNMGFDISDTFGHAIANAVPRHQQITNQPQTKIYASFDEQLRDLCAPCSASFLHSLSSNNKDNIDKYKFRNYMFTLIINNESDKVNPHGADRYQQVRSIYKAINDSGHKVITSHAYEHPELISFNEPFSAINFVAEYELRITFTNPYEEPKRAVVFRKHTGGLNITMKNYPFVRDIDQSLTHKEFIYKLISELIDIWRKKNKGMPLNDVIVSLLFSDVDFDA